VNSSVRLGRVAGVEIGANWSVLLVAGLIAWLLAGDILPTLSPGQPAAAYWAAGGTVVVVFYSALLAHELGHSIVARRRGVEVEEITLWFLGGVSKLRSDSNSAKDELRIALVGPLVSFALGAAFAVSAIVVDISSDLSLVVASLEWLALINLVLALFNLLPAFPLDGGRVLRAYLWRRSGDRVAATMSAVRTGNFVAYFLIALGVLDILSGALFGGVWLMLIGWFILSAARAEATAVTAQGLLRDVRIDQVMTRDPESVPGDITVAELVEHYVLGSRHSAYPLVDRVGAPLGLITLDRVRSVPAPARSSARVAEAAFAIDDVPVVGPSDRVADLLPRLTASRPRRALVVDDGRLVGILSATDIARAVDARAMARGIRV
jgi:Zn-dependent protease